MELPNTIRSTQAAFVAGNPVLQKGQTAFETDTFLSKVGDGLTAFNSLGYSQTPHYHSVASGTGTYVATFKFNVLSIYFTGMPFLVKFTSANAGAATLNVNSMGAKAIKKNVSVALTAGDIAAGGIYWLIYDGTNFQITSPVAGSFAVPTLAQVLTAGNNAAGQNILNANEISTTVGNYQTFSYYQTTGDYMSHEVINGVLGEHASIGLSLETPTAPYAGMGAAALTWNSAIKIQGDNILLTGTKTGFTGAIYAADYSASYVTRSLVDKGYVDGLVSGSYVPLTRTLTINGSAQTLAADRTWTITVTGTSNRISVSGGAGLTPTIDISSSYVGQASITTLGTITTGTWTGTKISEVYGGTNQNSYTLGDILYSSASNTLSKLAGNTVGKKFLTQTGAAGLSAAPVWGMVLATDIQSGAALTKGDDTNVTLTLTGSPTNALLTDVTITAGWSGQLSLARGGTEANLTASNGGIFYSTGTAGAILAGTATANKMLLSGSSTTPSWSTSTIPTSAGATANKVLLSDGTNYVLSTPTFPNASATSGKTIRSDGTNWIASTATLSDAPSTSGKFLRSDGTNWATSTLVLPNAITAGSIVFGSATDTYGQNNSNLFWDNTNNVLLLGATSRLVTDSWFESQANVNAQRQIILSNINGGSSTFIQYGLRNGTAISSFGLIGTGRATTGLYGTANRTYIDNDQAAGIGIGATHASGIISFYTGGTADANERARFSSAGSFLVGATALVSNEIGLFQKNQNAVSSIFSYNTTSGTAAGAAFGAIGGASTTGVYLKSLSAGYTSSGINVASTGIVLTDMTAGMNIGTVSNTQLSFWTNNTQKASISGAGIFNVGGGTGNVPSGTLLDIQTGTTGGAVIGGNTSGHRGVKIFQDASGYAYIQGIGRTAGAAVDLSMQLEGGSLLVGSQTAVSSEVLQLRKNQNAETYGLIYNSTAGTAARTHWQVSADTYAADLYAFSSSYTTSGAFLQNSALLYTGSTVSLGLCAAGAGSDIRFYTAGSATGNERVRITSVGNFKIAGTATRATTEGTNHLDIFDGTAPVGTLANGISLYSTSGELRVMDAAGNATLLSPHEKKTNYWIYDSVDTTTGKRLKIDMELFMKWLNNKFKTDFVHEYLNQ